MEHFDKGDEADSIQFKNLTVTFDRYDQIDDALEDSSADIQLGHGPTPYPIRLNVLQTVRTPFSDVPSLRAMTDCQVTPEHKFPSDWQDIFIDELADYCTSEQIGEVSTLDHEPDALYIQPHLTSSIIRVKTTTDTDSYMIDISLMPLEQFYHLRNASDEIESVLIEPLEYRDLHDVAHVWTKAQSILLSYIDSEAPYTTIHIGREDGIPRPANTLGTPDEPFEEDEPANIKTPRDAFDAIGGLFDAKQRLQEIALAFSHPEEAARYNISPSSFILQGEPGTGKTSLVRAFAEAADAELMLVRATDIQDKYISESSKNIRQKFNGALDSGRRTVLFFDEIDTLISENNHREFHNAAKTFGEIIEEAARDYPNIIIAGATNATASSLIPSVIRSGRLEIIYAGAPMSYEELREIWYVSLFSDEPPIQLQELTNTPASEPLYAADVDVIALANETLGMTGADIDSILRHARTKKFMAHHATGFHNPVTQSDIITEINAFKQRRSND